MAHDITLIGGGLAGCEAAWQAVREGARVRLYEMKPQRYSEAHHSADLAELVCSNSLRGAGMNNAVGCLKEELRRCGSLILAAADATAVPAGGALAVDREAFAAQVTAAIESHPAIEVIREEVTEIPAEGTVILASGPLTSPALSARIAALTGAEHLYFYDAIAPIIEADSIDRTVVFAASRYGKGGGDDYLNCPLDREQYFAFVAALKQAQKVPARDFEKLIHFEGCMPIEAMAERGEMTLAFGPMKPKGLTDPRTGRTPFAVVQLRQDNLHASLYNLVGFQTKLTYPEQQRLFRTLPGLENARFARLGSMHRNTFLNAPACLDTLRLKTDPRLFFAGQITGVEGYVESAACGFLAGLFAARSLRGEAPPLPPETTALGALLRHLRGAEAEGFQPMNVNYGLFPELEGRRRKRTDRRLALAERALEDLEPWRQGLKPCPPVPGRP